MYAIVDWLVVAHNALLASLQLPALVALIWGWRKGWYGSGRDWARTVKHMQAENYRMQQLVLSDYQIERIETKMVEIERDLARASFWTDEDGTVLQQQPIVLHGVEVVVKDTPPQATAPPPPARAIALAGSIGRPE